VGPSVTVRLVHQPDERELVEHITVNYRESYDMFAVSGILFPPRVAAQGPRVRDRYYFAKFRDAPAP
jgi:hypothetical protein